MQIVSIVMYFQSLSPYKVARHHPVSLLDQSLHILVDFRLSFNDVLSRSLLPWSCVLNVADGLLEASHLNLDLALCLFSVLDSDLLEGLNGLELLADIVRLWLEGLVVLFNLVNDLSVLKERSVVREIDFLRLLAQLLDASSGIVVSLLEVRQRGSCRTSEAELAANLGPVKLRNSALFKVLLAPSAEDPSPSKGRTSW